MNYKTNTQVPYSAATAAAKTVVEKQLDKMARTMLEKKQSSKKNKDAKHREAETITKRNTHTHTHTHTPDEETHTHTHNKNGNKKNSDMTKRRKAYRKKDGQSRILMNWRNTSHTKHAIIVSN